MTEAIHLNIKLLLTINQEEKKLKLWRKNQDLKDLCYRIGTLLLGPSSELAKRNANGQLIHVDEPGVLFKKYDIELSFIAENQIFSWKFKKLLWSWCLNGWSIFGDGRIAFRWHSWCARFVNGRIINFRVTNHSYEKWTFLCQCFFSFTIENFGDFVGLFFLQ